MHSKLHKQINQIEAYNPEITAQRRLAWLQAAMKRREFLEDVQKDIANTSFPNTKKGAKARRKAYSDAVVAYDKKNMRVFH